MTGRLHRRHGRCAEIFAGGGLAYIPTRIAPLPAESTLEIFARGGSAIVRSLTAFELSSIWGGRP